jgi:hypothetical protein
MDVALHSYVVMKACAQEKIAEAEEDISLHVGK